MVIALLIVILAVSALVCFGIARFFDQAIRRILNRLVPEDLAWAWQRYITFAIYVVGISGGVGIWALERYLGSRAKADGFIELDATRWVLEIYRALIETLQGIAWMLFVFFVVALLAFVIQRGFELRRGGGTGGAGS